MSVAHAQAPDETPVSAEAPDEISADEAVAASADAVETGRIVFFRTGRGGGAVKFHVHDMEGKPMGYLGKSGDSFAIEVEPGTHQYWSRAASRNDVIVPVEANQTYWVKAVVKMGAAVGRPVLELIPESKVPKKVLEAYNSPAAE